MSLHQRVKALEAGVTALARAEFGDAPGHEFRGNQYVAASNLAAGDTIAVAGKQRRVENVATEGDRLRVRTSHPDERVLKDYRFAKDETVKVVRGSLELGDVAGHDFHGNQWTAAGGSPNYDLHVEPHPWREGMVEVRIDKKNDPYGKNWDSRAVKPGGEAEAIKQLASSYNIAQEKKREEARLADREKNTSRTPEQVGREIDGINDELRDQGSGYTATSLPRDRLLRALSESENPKENGTGTVKPPSGSEISITNSTLKKLVSDSRG